MVLALAPWLVVYEMIAGLGASPLAMDTRFAFEREWPVREWTAVFYLGAYAWVPLAPWFAGTRGELRAWIRDGWVATVFVAWCFLCLPLVSPARGFSPSGFWGEWLLLDRSMDTPACAFPSFHVFWAFMAARLWRNKIGRAPACAVAWAIAASCVTAGNHSLLDVAAGALVFAGAVRCAAVWRALVRAAEYVANGWRDWRAGPVRVLNHGAYVAAAVTAGLLVAGALAGAEHTAAIVTVSLCSLAGACLWGQWLEASSVLSRPFGYFGGLFGGVAGVFLVQVIWGGGWVLAGTFAVAAPIFQGVGRLRCLVQGCCHGRPVRVAGVDARAHGAAPGTPGICYHTPLSRVVRIAGWSGVPVYPTQVYSIVANAMIFGLLARLWFERADCAFVCGVYLFLSTCARFVEEAYRGEPQTPRWHGLAIYQWLSIACVFAAMVLMGVKSPAAPSWRGMELFPLAHAVPLGLLAWLAMGVDFPASRRRMSRLVP
jgi:hypothetical protein